MQSTVRATVTPCASGLRVRERPPCQTSIVLDAPSSCNRVIVSVLRNCYNSAGFATRPFRPVSEGPCGETGRRTRLKIESREACWFRFRARIRFSSGQFGTGSDRAADVPYPTESELNAGAMPNLTRAEVSFSDDNVQEANGEFQRINTYCCVYRKLKSGRNDGEARRGWGVNE